MSGPFANWLRLPSRIALLLGLGALSAAGTNPSAAEADAGKKIDSAPWQDATEFGDLRMWTEGGRIYMAEAGKPGEDLCLDETLEARHLRELLEQHGATAASRRVPLNRMILAGGGGCGFDWPPPNKNRVVSTPAANGMAGFGPAKPVNSRQLSPVEKAGSHRDPAAGRPPTKG
jgi:hypothetical protein